MTVCVKCGEDFTAEMGTCELCSNEIHAKPSEISIASDYAVLEAGGYRLYYGYERVDENGDWQFVAELPENTFSATHKQLKCPDQWNCGECLLLGIGWLISQGHLTPKPVSQ